MSIEIELNSVKPQHHFAELFSCIVDHPPEDASGFSLRTGSLQEADCHSRPILSDQLLDIRRPALTVAALRRSKRPRRR